MKITTFEISDRKQVIEVQVHLEQNGQTAIIADQSRRYAPEWEPIEQTYARALREAADWLEAKLAGPVNLQDTGGTYVRRS